MPEGTVLTGLENYNVDLIGLVHKDIIGALKRSDTYEL